MHYCVELFFFLNTKGGNQNMKKSKFQYLGWERETKYQYSSLFPISPQEFIHIKGFGKIEITLIPIGESTRGSHY